MRPLAIPLNPVPMKLYAHTQVPPIPSASSDVTDPPTIEKDLTSSKSLGVASKPVLGNSPPLRGGHASFSTGNQATRTIGDSSGGGHSQQYFSVMW